MSELDKLGKQLDKACSARANLDQRTNEVGTHPFKYYKFELSKRNETRQVSTNLKKL